MAKYVTHGNCFIQGSKDRRPQYYEAGSVIDFDGKKPPKCFELIDSKKATPKSKPASKAEEREQTLKALGQAPDQSSEVSAPDKE